jgi:hypothetical protein
MVMRRISHAARTLLALAVCALVGASDASTGAL